MFAGRRTPLLRCLWLIPLSVLSWVSAEWTKVAQAEPATQRVEFGIFWPPADPSKNPNTKALLEGCVTLRLQDSPHSDRVAHLRITLTRSSDEDAREFWNSRLAFPEYDWMRYVRVWDADQRWLWPNLPYLLRLPGRERIERYGGVDPGKGVDNDFAAVLIRKYDASGQQESEVSRKAPLVSAEWYPVGVAAAVDKQTIVHTAQSDEFALHLGGAETNSQGRAGVWLVYADFMGAKLPMDWPKAPEFAGGILAYFEMIWELKTDGRCEIRIQHMTPKQGTGFDWERWANRTRAAADPKRNAVLTDSALPRTNSPSAAPNPQPVTPGQSSPMADRPR
jgi:hypothetical protein